MTSLLIPLRNHCDKKTEEAIDKTMEILQNIGYGSKEVWQKKRQSNGLKLALKRIKGL